ncbi:unnamed protein product [Lathyrus sativus]|nr:unnamed protein product [Lathyrus sativus]
MYLAVNCTLVSLIPKGNGGNCVKDFRPISCCTTFYKIISKILTRRLSKVLTIIINQSQAAFIPRQNIHDHILLAYELIQGYNRKDGTPSCLLQLDIQKSYDTLDWYALECILKEFGFPHKFTKWIMLAVSTVSYKFNVAGRITRSLKAKRGLRQGDPISPLLFVLTMEYFHRLLHQLSKVPDYNFHAKCEKLQIIDISFADDVLHFTRGDNKSVQLLMDQLQTFSQSTGLLVNPAKCRVYFGGGGGGGVE